MAESLTQEEASKSPKLLVAAIDFGTVYSGYAYSFKYEWTKIKINNWGGGENLSYKTPSVLLLNPDQSFNSFGYQAERKYAELAENGSECKKYFYFQRFKMILRTSLEKVTWYWFCRAKIWNVQYTFAIKYHNSLCLTFNVIILVSH